MKTQMLSEDVFHHVIVGYLDLESLLRIRNITKRLFSRYKVWLKRTGWKKFDTYFVAIEQDDPWLLHDLVQQCLVDGYWSCPLSKEDLGRLVGQSSSTRCTRMLVSLGWIEGLELGSPSMLLELGITPKFGLYPVDEYRKLLRQGSLLTLLESIVSGVGCFSCLGSETKHLVKEAIEQEYLECLISFEEHQQYLEHLDKIIPEQSRKASVTWDPIGDYRHRLRVLSGNLKINSDTIWLNGGIKYNPRSRWHRIQFSEIYLHPLTTMRDREEMNNTILECSLRFKTEREFNILLQGITRASPKLGSLLLFISNYLGYRVFGSCLKPSNYLANVPFANKMLSTVVKSVDNIQKLQIQ